MSVFPCTGTGMSWITLLDKGFDHFCSDNFLLNFYHQAVQTRMHVPTFRKNQLPAPSVVKPKRPLRLYGDVTQTDHNLIRPYKKQVHFIIRTHSSHSLRVGLVTRTPSPPTGKSKNSRIIAHPTPKQRFSIF